MGKITKYQQKELSLVLNNIGRTIEFIEQDTIAICRRDSTATTTLHYTRDDGCVLYEINKRLGSKLVSLWQAEDTLKTFLEQNR